MMQRLEHHATSLSTARTEDKKHIEMLEKELMNCSQEIGSSFFDISFALTLLVFFRMDGIKLISWNEKITIFVICVELDTYQN